jgi:endonuclease G
MNSHLLRYPAAFCLLRLWRLRFLAAAGMYCLLFSILLVETSCEKRQPLPTEPPTLFEDFEADTKGSYASAAVKLTSGRWEFEDAMLGSDQNDQKTGSKAARIRNNGAIRMLFDFPNGAKTVVLRHGVYAKDNQNTAMWEIRSSTDGGATWKRLGGATATSITERIAFAVNVTGKVRFEIRKMDGSATRLNIDDFGIIQAEQAPQSTTPTQASNQDRFVPPPQDKHLAMGVPADSDDSDDYLMQKKQYALSYNPIKHVPNWVSSQLTADNFGSVPRYSGKFMPDPQLPKEFYRVRHEDYTGSGYDRGHMVRSEERTDTPENNMATFLTTNILPQRHDLNAGPWLRLEELCQRLAQRSGKTLYIICGGVFAPDFPRIGRGGVAVPEQCFKIVVVLERGQTAKDITEKTTILSVLMPNIEGIAREDWRKYVCSIDDIERATGYDFLTAVPVAIQHVIESRRPDVRQAN